MQHVNRLVNSVFCELRLKCHDSKLVGQSYMVSSTVYCRYRRNQLTTGSSKISDITCLLWLVRSLVRLYEDRQRFGLHFNRLSFTDPSAATSLHRERVP